jgi:hypothetical protein
MLTAPEFAADPATFGDGLVTPVEPVRADDWDAPPPGADISPAGTDVASLPLLGGGGGDVHDAPHPSWSLSYARP